MTNVQLGRVTVCIPTRNRAGLLAAAIESVLAQTFRDFRLLVADNASTDRTAELVAGLDDPRVVYSRSDRDLGLVGNYNRCLELAGSELVLVLGDDDLLYPDFLAEAVAAFDRNPGVGVVHSAFDVIDGNGERLADGNWTYGLTEDTVESGPEFLTESMRHSCRICGSTALVRTEAISGGMDERDFPAIDFGLWLRIAAAGWSFAFLARPLGGYRVHAETESARRLGPPQGAGYVNGPDGIERLREVKLRFLDQNAAGLERPEELRRLVSVCARRELIVLAEKRTLGQERLALRRARFLVEAARLDPAALLDERTYRTLAADLVRRGIRRGGGRRPPRPRRRELTPR